MSMAEIWSLCDDAAPQKKYGDLTEAEAADLVALLNQNTRGSA